MHIAVLAGHRQRDLAFEIEMILAADVDAGPSADAAPASAAAASPRVMRWGASSSRSAAAASAMVMAAGRSS